MENKTTKLVLSGAPHFVTGNDIQKTMGMVIIALLPALAGGVYYFGPRALLLTAVSVVSAVVAEFLFRTALHRETHVTDLSAVITGMLLALILPVSSPLWMAAVGSAFAIVVAKELFGGLGGNFANPALVGRAVLLMSWPAFMTRWSPSLHTAVVDATTTATPLGVLKLGGAIADVMKSVGVTEKSALYLQMFLGIRAAAPAGGRVPGGNAGHRPADTGRHDRLDVRRILALWTGSCLLGAGRRYLAGSILHGHGLRHDPCDACRQVGFWHRRGIRNGPHPSARQLP
jgi:Na+-transporting NADH:ubiquinone oxidoreductase subunit NqrB